ncbi:Zn(2)-C6 fungal-type DNA-binding domain protein [Metarhizium robertsii ARSEF 23]|uniref:Zn(2)-C6 fungal-type DNA-binding domain protein n=1 Tax=Metarhizium robertsii (strain ARSEF 23 / ATCC MYA-3075) TaxID=655844 RepID=A0A0B2XIE0_METRA|nr:Zn(2)-C6 fungal-type DNA-binding domain protein [Metarhizium robertsii ARSEF 23]KHO11684.1 Zn(2)-C6 fungal-type DNA-binding domain protein [Metarhizium robertsii ARSEF 23]
MSDSILETEAPVPSGKGPPKKRRRVVVSCTECHRRKQKCDRELPCANCRSRNRETFCSYDPSARTSENGNTTINNNSLITKISPSTQVPQISASSTPPKITEPLSTMAATWGYGQTGASTISFLKKIETAPSFDDQSSLSTLSLACTSREDSFAVRERYKDLIRHLPAKVFIDKLVAMCMREFNWQYYFVDPDIFFAQLQEWNNLPFSIFSTEGPRGIPPGLRVFPAVLFQMIAAALLVLPDDEEEEFVTLKYAANMTFEDLACDYSASGAEIVGLFGKKGLSVTTVQAEFLRACFLKYTANVTESWHMIGIAIRDAQELGMHRDSLDPKPTETSLETVIENQWLIERRRKMYMILAMWDINMSLILGRPGTVDWRHSLPSLPIDTPVPSNRSNTPIAPRNPEKDPPTPLTRCLWLHEITLPLRDIQDLEHEGPYPRDFSKIDRVHQKIMSLHESTPAILRLKNPDTRWDNDPEVEGWIGGTRYYFHFIHNFTLMALHRPYLFHRKESRLEALTAGLAMLEMQRSMFEGLPSTSWRNFMLFFGTFDAIVLVASVYILFPHEHPEHRHLSVQHIHWAIERFATMQHRNPLAKAAQGVLRAILGKFTKALAHSASPSKSSITPASTRGPSDNTPASGSARLDANANPAPVWPASSLPGASMAKSAVEGEDVGNARQDTLGETWLSPSEWAFAPDGLSNIMPTFAISDLIYNDLTAVQDGGGMMAAAEMAPSEGGASEWQFGGDIAEGTLWQVLNRFQPR